METKKYRVEVFITPQINTDTNINFNKLPLDVVNEVSQHDCNTETNHESVNNTTESFFCNTNLPVIPSHNILTDISENACSTLKNDESIESSDQFENYGTCRIYPEEHIYDEPFVGLQNSKLKNTLKNKLQLSRYSQRYLPRPPKRTSSLKSIDETTEILEQTCQDICYHGHKNGCTVAVQQPEEVSQEIFKENWLQKLEALRQREALLRDKELALQSQERLLFKKERQLRILDRLVRDKMKQAELYLKRCKQLPGFENLMNAERSSESGFSHSSKGSKTESGREYKFHEELKSADLHIYDEINIKNPPNSRSSLVTTSTEISKVQSNLTSSHCVRSTKFSMHNSFRFKQRPKLAYDDLDSTLSADVGDSSFAVTATKFNPNVFKKPTAFQRSISERRPAFAIAKSNVDHGFEQNKILKKFSENIMTSQSKDTKFQNYGLIDNGHSNDVRPKSASAAESGHKKSDVKDGKDVNVKTLKRTKERPNSWNAENDDWLQKKRQEYNMSIRRIPSVMNNKENQQVQLKNDKQVKEAKKEKKEGKSRKFMIFR